MLVVRAPEKQKTLDDNFTAATPTTETKQAEASAPALTKSVIEVFADDKKKKKVIKIPSELKPRSLYPQQSRSFFHNPTTQKTWYDFEILPKFKLSLEKAATDTVLIRDKNSFVECTIQMPNKEYKTIVTKIPTPSNTSSASAQDSLKRIKKEVRLFLSQQNLTPLPDEAVENNKIYLEVKDDHIHYTMKDKNGQVVRSAATDILVDPSQPFMIDTLNSKIEEQVLTAASKHLSTPQRMYAGIPVTDQIKVASTNQAHSAIDVPEGCVGLVKMNGKPLLLSPGRWDKPYGVEFISNRSATDKTIHHETVHVITVLPGELVYAEDSQDVQNSKYLLPGKHFIDSPSVKFRHVSTPNGIFVRAAKTEEEYKEEKKHNEKAVPYWTRFVRTPDGKVYIAFDERSMKRILPPGLNDIPPEWTVLPDSISTKVKNEEVEIFCQTKNGVNVCVKATVTYQIPITDNGMGYELAMGADIAGDLKPGKVYIYQDKSRKLSYAVVKSAGTRPETGWLDGITVPSPFSLEELNKQKDQIMEITSAAGHTKSVECMFQAIQTFGPTPKTIEKEIKKISIEAVATQVKKTVFSLDSEEKEKNDQAPPAYGSNEAEICTKATETLKKSKDICEGGVKILNISIQSMVPTDLVVKEAVANAAAREIEIKSSIHLDAMRRPDVQEKLQVAAAKKIIADAAHEAEMRKLQQERTQAEERQKIAALEEAELDRLLAVEEKKQRLAQLRAQNSSATSFSDGARSPASLQSTTATLTRTSLVCNNTTAAVTVHASTSSKLTQ